MKRNSFNVLFFIKKAKLLKNGEASVCMRITVNSGNQHLQEHRPCVMESSEGMCPWKKPQGVRPECLYRKCENQAPPNF